MAVPSRECSTEDSSKASRAVCKGVRGEASADSFKNRSGLVRPSVAFLVKQLAASPFSRIPYVHIIPAPFARRRTTYSGESTTQSKERCC